MHTTRLLQLTHTPASWVRAYNFDRNKAYMNGGTYASTDAPIKAEYLYLINHLKNKRYTIGIIQIWSQLSYAAHVT
jgi:hypothetical protein